MAKKTSKKSLKSLFSRSEASLAAHAEKDVDKTEKKSFKFPKFGKKSKRDSEKPESLQVLSGLESSDTAENRGAWADNAATKSKMFSLYGTTPRSKGKEFSYSELDLRKPKRFSTFSFGLRKRRTKDADGISKSTFGLHHQDIEEEAPLDFRQMELDQTKTIFSMSQPELDSSSTFDIPSPPPVATNQSDPFFSLFSKSQSAVSINTQSDAKDPQKKDSDVFDAPTEMKAPITSIPELQPGNPSFSQEKEDIPVHVTSSKSDSNSATAVTPTQTASDAGYQTLPMLPASLAQMLRGSNRKAVVVESVSSSDSQCDDDCLQQSHTLDKTPVAASPVTLSHYAQPDAPDTADSTATNVEPSLAIVDSNTDTTIIESTPAFHSDFTAETHPAPQEISMSHTEGSIPETAKRIATGAAVRREKSLHPVDENAVYGALCESLLPQSFTSEAMSTLSNPPPQIQTEIRHLNTKLEPVMVKTLDDDNVSSSDNQRDDDCLQQFHTLSHYAQPDAPDTADSTATNVEPSLAIVDSNTDTTIIESTPAFHSDFTAKTDPAPQEISMSHTEGSIPETAKRIATFSAVGREKSLRPVDENAVYGALCESLLPQSFTSEAISTLSNPPPQIQTEMRHLNTKLESAMVKTLDDDNAGTNITYSLSTTMDDTVRGRANRNESNEVSIESKVISHLDNSRFTPPQTTVPAFEPHGDVHHRYLPPTVYSGYEPDDSSKFSYTELTYSLSEGKSGSSSLIPDTARSVPAAQISAPPICSYATSQGTATRVTDSIRKAILVKEIATHAVGSDTGRPSPVPEEITPAKRLGIKMEATDHLRQVDGLGGHQSPTYLSVGSDDGSMLEIYYSAEEDNGETGDEERYTVDKREEIGTIHWVREVIGLRQEIPHRGEIAEGGKTTRSDGELKGVAFKMQNEDGKMDRGEKQDGNNGAEVQQQQRGHSLEAEVQKSGKFLAASDAKTQQREEVAATVFSHVKEEGWEERKEELLATPVQQVNTPMVCDVAPPSGERYGERDSLGRNWPKKTESDDPSNGEKQLPGHETEYVTYKDDRHYECIHAATRNTSEKHLITPISKDAAEQGTLPGKSEQKGEVSKDGTQSSGNLTTSAVTDASRGVEVVSSTLTSRSEVGSDATNAERNRARQNTEWVDTVAAEKVPQQVAVELSTPSTGRPATEAAHVLAEGQERLAGARHPVSQGSRSVTSLRLPSGASRVFGWENRLSKAEQESADEMESVYSSLSTTRSTNDSSLPQKDESKYGFGKVSAGSMRGMSGSASNEADSGSKYRWKNRFEGVSQYRPYGTEESSLSDSLSYGMSDSSSSISSVAPENTARKYYDNASSSPHPLPEEHAFANVLNDKLKVYLRYEGEPVEEQKDDWRRGLVEQEEPAAPADERERGRGRESEVLKSHWDSQRLPLSAQQTSSGSTVHFQESSDHESEFTGVFKATRVDLIPDPAAPPSSLPSSPDRDSPNQLDMEILVDTLKSMGPSLRPRNTSIRAPAPVLVSGLPPIVEDSGSPVVSDVPDSIPDSVPDALPTSVPDSVPTTTKKTEPMDNAAASPNGFYVLPTELGMKRGPLRDGRSPLEMIRKNHQEQPGTRELNSPLRTSLTNTLLMRKALDSSPEDVQVLNGNGGALPSPSSRLENSVVFGKTSSIEQILEHRQSHRTLFHTSSLPESGLLKDRVSMAPKEVELGSADPGVSRFDRFSYLLNSTSSTSPGSFTLADDHSPHISRLPALGISSPPLSNSPTHLLSPTGSIDLHRPFTTDSPLSMFSQPHGMGAGTGRAAAPILQRNFSDDATGAVQQSSQFRIEHGGPQFLPQEPERNLASKYRAFPDAYLTKEKEHGKLNPRPGKIFIFDRPGMCGQRIEVRSDVTNATSWELQETISIRVIRGGWVLYEKPEFKGGKIALDEGDIELTNPFGPPEEEQQQNGHGESKEQSEGTGDEQAESKPARGFVIGSLRRVVRDYSVPEISLFPEQNAEGKKVIFRDTSDDARIFGFPIKAQSIIVNAGLWLVFAHPFFQGEPRVLEVGGYTNPEAWGVEQPLVGSLHPLKIGEPKVENMTEPKIMIYHKPYFTGKSRTITTNMRDFMTRTDQDQGALMFNAGSLKVLGGIWVGYEKEGFRGHQYLLEEGDYHDWRVWGGLDPELRSVRMIRADLTDPLMVMFEQQEEERQSPEENSFEVTEAIPDVELFDYKTSTSSIHVVSGAWIAYSHVDFSGNQYILEKGFYNNSADWGSQDNRICSVQPILLAPSDGSSAKNQVMLYSEPDFKGECQVINCNQEAITSKRLTKSCKVSRGSWVIYEDNKFSGNSYVLSEGDYPNLASMGCPPSFSLHSIKAVPMMFCIPSISLFGLECLEGKEITMETEIFSMVEEGFNNHILSLRVNSGCWVIFEHSNYRGRQFLLEPIEITNWVKFSSLQTIGSMYPVRQKRRYFRIKNKESGHFMSIQGGVEEMKSGRVVVSQEVEPMSDIWFYQDGFIKSKLSSNKSLQVMGNPEPGTKVVLWTETRQPMQTWTAQMRGLITSHTFRGMVLDVKGGNAYDKDHVVILPEDDERPSQQWEIELL